MDKDAKLGEKMLYVAVWDYDKWKSNDYMGAMTFPLSELLRPENKCVHSCRHFEGELKGLNQLIPRPFPPYHLQRGKFTGWFKLLDKKQGALYYMQVPDASSSTRVEEITSKFDKSLRSKDSSSSLATPTVSQLDAFTFMKVRPIICPTVAPGAIFQWRGRSMPAPALEKNSLAFF